MEVRTAPLPVDAAAYTVQDGAGTVRSAPPRWRALLDGVDDLPHATAVALDAVADALRAAGGTGETVDDLAAPVNAALLEVAKEHGATAPLVGALDAAHPLVTAVESVDRFLSAAARAVAVDLVTPGTGRIAGVHRSAGGVPKLPVDRAEVGASGLVGDRQKVRRHHGRPSQALCLWSAEVIEELAEEGHPVAPGAAGENLTLEGFRWGALRPGVRLVLGGADDAPVAEITGWTEPCSTIAHCFTGREFRRIDQLRHPGWSRAYAAVVRPGVVEAGDTVTVLP
ncbi:MAG: MOSC domain-containing protein [Microthrixaceae bacterium]